MHKNNRIEKIKLNQPDEQESLTDNIEYMISEMTQLIWDYDFPKLLNICPTDNMLHSVNRLIAIEQFVADAKVKIINHLFLFFKKTQCFYNTIGYCRNSMPTT